METVEKKEEEVDEKGVPLTNRFKEFERKMEDKYAKELELTRKELQELKASMTAEEQPQQTQGFKKPEDVAKDDLMEFVKNPRGFVASTFHQSEFQRQIPEAEKWLKSQKGYSDTDESEIARIIQENKLNTPYHTPMERAKTAWQLRQAERMSQSMNSQDDDARRETKASATAGEGIGKSTPKQSPVTREDIIKKLAVAEQKGDLDAAIKYTSLLEDIR